MHLPESVISRCATWHFNYRRTVMAELGLQALHRRVAGIDVHRMLHVVTVLIEQDNGSKDNGSIQRQAR